MAPRAGVPGRPRGQPEEVAGRVQPRWDTSNPVAWLGQKGRNTGMPLSLLPHAARHGPSLASAALGSPRGLWLLGVFCQREDGAGAALAPLPVHSPVPGRHSSQGWAVWHPTRQPRLRRGHQPRPWGHGHVVSPVCCPAPGSCSFLCPDDINQGSPVPRPAGWTARSPRPVGSEGPAGLRPPERGGFIHNLVEYFQCYPGLGLAGAGEAVSGPTAAVPPCPCRGWGRSRHAVARLHQSRVAVVLHD